MRKIEKLLLLPLVSCLLMIWVSGLTPPAVAADSVITVTGEDDIKEVVQNAPAGSVIEIQTTAMVDPVSFDGKRTNDDPWVLDKPLTFRGGTLAVCTGGIVLGADVTFDNVEIRVMNPNRSAIMANGYTLILNHVRTGSGSWDLHLFCGGPSGSAIDERTKIPSCGPEGRIVIQGSTTVGNIYAGNISTDGTENCFAGNAAISMEPSMTGSVGKIFACGALQTPVEDNWFGYVTGEMTIAPPTSNAGRYRVTGDVTIELYGNAAHDVDGATGGERNAAVTFQDNQPDEVDIALSNLGSLTVRQGTLHPGKLSGDGMDMEICSGAALRLYDTDIPKIGNFTGNGRLILGQAQTLDICDSVCGETTLLIGREMYDGTSGDIMRKGHVYITAPVESAQEGNFVLKPAAAEDRKLQYAEGAWKAVGLDAEPVFSRFDMDAEVTVQPGEAVSMIEIPLKSVFQENGADPNDCTVSNMPLELTVSNSAPLQALDEVGYCYRFGDKALQLEVSQCQDDEGNPIDVLSVVACVVADENDWMQNTLINPPAGIYKIEITVPAEYTESGQAVSGTVVISVEDDTPGLPAILPPEAKQGLVYTGQEQIGVAADDAYYTIEGNTAINAGTYTAAVTPAAGYQWMDGTVAAKEISWEIARAQGPAAPENLAAFVHTGDSVTAELVGTTTEMEYCEDPNFSGTVTRCDDYKTAVEPDKTYYVRMHVENTDNYEIAYATVAVPPYITEISVNSTSHKTVYAVGEALDVTDLTIRVNISDGAAYTVPVDAEMVGGFDSTAAAASQTLTIQYRQHFAAEYTIQIKMPVSGLTVTLGTVSYIYDGSAKAPPVTVKDGSKVLVNGADYTAAYENNTQPGSGVVKITGLGDYTGTQSKTFTIKLAAPVMSGAVNTGSGVQLNWGKVAGATGYNVYRKAPTDTVFTKLAASSGTSCLDKTAKAGAIYQYQIKAYYVTADKAVIHSAGSGSIAQRRMLTPVISGAVNTGSGIMLSWSKVSGATAYTIYRKTASQGAYTALKATSGTSYTDTTAVAGTTYQYQVRAYCKSGSEVYYSAIGASRMQRRMKTPVITGAVNTNSGIKVSWGKIAGAAGYHIYRKTTAQTGYTRIAAASGTSYVDTTARAGFTYQYQIKAYYKAGNTVFYSGGSASKAQRRMKTPVITGAAKASTGIKISWGKVSGATAYTIYRKTSSQSVYTALKATSGASCVDTTAKTGVTYQYRIKAYCKSGGTTYFSALSSAKSAKG